MARPPEDQAVNWQSVLIQLGLTVVAPALAQLIVALFKQLTDSLQDQGVSPTTFVHRIWPDAMKVVAGINTSPNYSTWSALEKATMAQDAIRALIRNEGGNPSDKNVNWIVESAVQFAAIKT